jgi:kumamolisin
MRRGFAALAIAAGALAGCSVPSTGAPMPDHQPERVIGAQDIGLVPRDEQVDLVLSLKMRDLDGVHRLLSAQNDSRSSSYRQYLTPQAFGERFGTTPDDYQRVVDWATSYNLTVTRTTDSRTTVSLRGSAADIERAFGTQLHKFSDANGEFRAPTQDLSILGHIAGLIDGIGGLDDAARWKSRRVQPPAPVPNAGPGGRKDPADLQAMYGVTGLSRPGDGATVAILGTGDPPLVVEDVDYYIKKFNLPTQRAAQYTQVFVGGPNRDSTELAQNEYGENVLDIDMVLALAPYANVVHVHTALNSPGLFEDGIVFIINNLPQAHQASVSYGVCERVAATGIVSMNNLLLQAKLQGQSWFFATGDDGTDGCRDGKGNKVLSAGFPTGSPYAVGVGGTQITGGKEIAWAGGGGGQSQLALKPDYQIGVGPYANDGVRDTPDVAALAGSPGVTVGFQGQVTTLLGTSAATPMWAAVWSILDQHTGYVGITNIHERLYDLGRANSPAFNDITAGNNSNGVTPGFPAIVGYDLATGWGTPNTTKLLEQW